MNKWKMTFLLLTGFQFCHLLSHIWLGLDGLLPYTSKLLFGLTITPEFNMLAIMVNIVILSMCAYLAFLHRWGHRQHVERHA